MSLGSMSRVHFLRCTYWLLVWSGVKFSNSKKVDNKPTGSKCEWLSMKFSLPPPPGYAVPNATAPVSAAQLKQAVTLGQDLAYTTYEVYPTFAVTARGDGYGAFWRYLSFNLRHTKLYLEEINLSLSFLMITSHTFSKGMPFLRLCSLC